MLVHEVEVSELKAKITDPPKYLLISDSCLTEERGANTLCSTSDGPQAVIIHLQSDLINWQL